MKYILASMAVILLCSCAVKEWNYRGNQRLGLYSVDSKVDHLKSKYPAKPGSGYNLIDNGIEIRDQTIENFVRSVKSIQSIFEGSSDWAKAARPSDDVYLPLLLSAAGRFALIEGISPEFEEDLFAPISNWERFEKIALKMNLPDYNPDARMWGRNKGRVESIPNGAMANCIHWVGLDYPGCEWFRFSGNSGSIQRIFLDSKAVYDGTNEVFWAELTSVQGRLVSNELSRAAVLYLESKGKQAVRDAMSKEGQELYDQWAASTNRAFQIKEFNPRRHSSRSPFVRNGAIWDPISRRAYHLNDDELNTLMEAIKSVNAAGTLTIENDSIYIVNRSGRELILTLGDKNELTSLEVDALGGWETR